MATDKRARQRANRQLKLEQQDQHEKREKVRHYGFLAAIVALAVIAGLALLSLTGGDDDDAAATGSESETATDETAATDEAATGDADTDGEPATEPLPCPAEDGSSEQVLTFPAAPPDCLVDGATYTATVETSLGTVVAQLDPGQAPVTVNNFVYLARYHYYDGTLFHRVIQDFVIQGGDATGEPPGTGGPGYTIAEEVPEPGQYELGSLVMAKRTAPSTTGAQFFVVTGPDGEALPNQYSLFGQVTEGLDVAEAIGAVPTDGADRPVEDVVVESITIDQG